MKKELKINSFKLLVFRAIQNGFSSKQICEKYNITLYALSYYYRLLKKENAIKKIGYGVWEITQKELKKLHLDNPLLMSKELKTIRSHAFGFYLKIPHIENWRNREQFFIRENIKHKQGTLNHVQAQRIIYKDFHITFFNKGIKFLSVKQKNEFLTNSATLGKELAIKRVIEIIKGLEGIFKVSFEINRQYQIKVSKQHQANIKNELAKFYNQQHKKFKCYDEQGAWLLIDVSLNVDELETIRGEDAHLTMDNAIMPFFNSLKAKPFTAYDIEGMFSLLNKFGEIVKLNTEQTRLNTEQAGVFAELNKEHFRVLKGIDESIGRLSEAIPSQAKPQIKETDEKTLTKEQRQEKAKELLKEWW